MLIRSMLNRKGSAVVTILPTASIAEAVHSLSEHRIGALVVSSDGQSIDGILSERDIVRSLAKDGAPTMDKSVEALMTSKVQTCTGNASIAQLMELMTQKRIRHLPVESDGKLKGLVSIGDVVQARLHELESERKQIEEYISS